MSTSRFAGGIVAAVLLSISAVAGAASPQIVEGFGCNFRDGKGFDDLQKATDFWLAQLKKIDNPGLNKMGAVLWTPVIGSVDVDFVWFNNNMTLEDWGSGTKAYAGSEAGQAADAKFAEVVKCNSGLATNEMLYQTEKTFADDGGVLIESYACNFKAGKGLADSDKAVAVWKPVFDKAIKATGAASFVARRTPLISGRGVDLAYLAVWDDAEAYAKASSAYLEDPASAKAGAAFDSAHTCRSALFNGRILKPWTTE